MNYKYSYNPKKFCVAKGKYIDEMILKRDSSNFFIRIRHEMDGQGNYTNNYHIYSTEEITKGMEFRQRRDGNLYYIKLNREETTNLLGNKAIEF